MGLKIKINVVNKYEYNDDIDYKEVVVRLPIKEEQLNDIFWYLKVSDKKDAQVLSCEVVDENDPHFSAVMGTVILSLIYRGKDVNYKTSYHDIKAIYDILQYSDDEVRDKILAIYELTNDRLSNIKDFIKYLDNMEEFEFHRNITTAEQYADELIDDSEVDMYDLIDFVDKEALGNTYCENNDGKFTDYGLIFPVDSLTFNNEEEEEFE